MTPVPSRRIHSVLLTQAVATAEGARAGTGVGGGERRRAGQALSSGVLSLRFATSSRPLWLLAHVTLVRQRSRGSEHGLWGSNGPGVYPGALFPSCVPLAKSLNSPMGLNEPTAWGCDGVQGPPPFSFYSVKNGEQCRVQLHGSQGLFWSLQEGGTQVLGQPGQVGFLELLSGLARWALGMSLSEVRFLKAPGPSCVAALFPVASIPSRSVAVVSGGALRGTCYAIWRLIIRFVPLV